MSPSHRSLPEILWVDPEPPPLGFIDTMHEGKWPIRAARDEDEALRHLSNPGIDLAVILGNHRMLRRMASALSHSDQVRHGHLVRLLITDGHDPRADFVAINEVPVFRVLQKPLDPGSTGQHLREAMELHARRCLESLRCEDGGASLRDALAFLAHEINTPLSLIQGYTHALHHRQGAFATAPAPTEAVKQALEASERSARYCQSLVTWVAETAHNACARRTPAASSAAGQMRALLESYPYAGGESAWVSIDVEHDFPLLARTGLLHLVFFTLMRTALSALQGTARPHLRITVGFLDGGTCIRLSHNGKPPPPEVLAALAGNRSRSPGSLGMGLVFCQRAMRSLRGDFQIEPAPNEETVAVLCFDPAPRTMTDPVDPRKRDLTLRSSP